MNVHVLELQEANKDILMGKRRLECLSCGENDYYSATLKDIPRTTFKDH